MFKISNYNNYKIVTSKNLYDYINMNELEEESFKAELYQEQKEILKNTIESEYVVIHFLEDAHFNKENYYYTSKQYITEYLEYLAIKDGVNLVQFETGNLGFIAYYNGHKNGFEIIEPVVMF